MILPASNQLRLAIRIFFFVFTVFIVLVSTKANMNDSDREWGSNFLIRLDYVFHFSAFFVWGLLLRFSIPVRWVKTMWHLFSIIVLAALFTYFVEFAQKFIPGRAYNPYDLLANFLGLIFALGVHRLSPRKWNKFFRHLTDNS